MKPKNTSWDAVANWYDSLVMDDESYQQEVILPNFLRLAGDVRGKRVLDVASGQGLFSHALAKAGATVTGIELSPELVNIARKSAMKGENFIVGNAEKFPSEIKSGGYDLALCVLALQNIKNLDAVVSEASRALAPRGRFLIVLNHPCFRIPKRSAWGYDEEQKIQYRRLDGYLSESSADIVAHPGRAKSQKTVSLHRPLQLYFKSFVKYGFAVERLEEWISNKTSESGPRKIAEDNARKELPLFLYLGLVKPR